MEKRRSPVTRRGSRGAAKWDACLRTVNDEGNGAAAEERCGGLEIGLEIVNNNDDGLY